MLDEAIAVAKKRAQANCQACRLVGTRIVGVGPHTCHGDLAIVRDCMLAAAECKLGSEKAKKCIGTSGGPNDKDCETCVKAEIKRLFGLPEGSEKEGMK